MNILVNGESRTFNSEYNLAQLVDSLGLGEKRLAVEVNNNIVPRSEHPSYRLHDGDKIEIVRAIGGG